MLDDRYIIYSQHGHWLDSTNGAGWVTKDRATHFDFNGVLLQIRMIDDIYGLPPWLMIEEVAKPIAMMEALNTRPLPRPSVRPESRTVRGESLGGEGVRGDLIRVPGGRVDGFGAEIDEGGRITIRHVWYDDLGTHYEPVTESEWDLGSCHLHAWNGGYVSIYFALRALRREVAKRYAEDFGAIQQAIVAAGGDETDDDDT